MAQDQPTGSLPQFYGQHLPDGTTVESPNFPLGTQTSRDTLLRLPIQPHPAHVQDQDALSPTSPVPVPTTTAVMGIETSPSARAHAHARTRTTGDASRWLVPQGASYEPEEYYEGRSSYQGGPRRGPSYRAAYVEDYEYDDEEDRPRPYRRPARRHTRPPPAHGRVPPGPPGRYSSEVGRGSYDYESDAGSKARIRTTYGGAGGYGYAGGYGSEEDEYRRPRARGGDGYGGGGGRGPPRQPPSPEEVMRLPFTAFMNSDFKNRRCFLFLGVLVGRAACS